MEPITTTQIATWLMGLIATLLSVITYFLRRHLNAVYELQEKAAEHETKQQVNEQRWLGHDKEHTVIDKRLNRHSEQINEHARKISVIEEMRK